MAAPTITSHRDLARLAVTELQRVKPETPADAVEDAEYYIGQAYDDLASRFSYDPTTYATAQARQAVVEYAKNRLQSLPGIAGSYPALAQSWARAAAVAWYVEDEAA